MPKQTFAIALCRVSSLEQLESNSLSHQEDNVLKAAEELGVTIPDDGIWSGHVSSKKGVNYSRKDLKEMLEYCRKHVNVKYLIVQEVDRFMRSPDEQVYFQVKFWNEVGVKIWYADKPELNKDDIYAGLMRYMEGFRAAGSNDERQRKSINGQTKALEEGRYPFAPKPGYKKGFETGIQEVDGARGGVLRDILISVASGLRTPTQALVGLNKSIFIKGRAPYKMDKFRKILIDPFYAGIVEMDKQVKFRNENGLHEPLISRVQHEELLMIMDNKKKNQSGPRKNGNPKYQVSNLVNCAECVDATNGRFVGLDLTNGRNKALVYEKYRCRSCKKYITKQALHSQIKKQFEDYQLSDEAREDLIKALSVVWKQNEELSAQELARLQHKIETISLAIENHVEAATDPSNASIKENILESIEKKKLEVKELENKVYSLDDKNFTDKERFMKFALGFVDNMGARFFEISKENRLRCKLLIFPGGIFVDSKNKVYTPEISELYRLASNKKDLSVTDKSLLVRVKRL